MASETSELTFVRCPSCRSLVPASAARCRICNNALEGNAQGAPVDANRPPGRVRQKTITASAEELLQGGGVGGDYTRSEPPPAQPFGGAPVGGAQEHEVVDPLADFLQDFDEPSAIPAPPPSQDVPAAAAANDDDDLDTFLDDFDAFNPGPEPVEEPAVPLPAQIPLRSEPDPFSQAGTESEPHGAQARDPFDLEPDPIGDLAVEVDDPFDLEMAPEPVREVAPPPRQAAPIPEPAPEPVPEPRRAPEPARGPRPERQPVQENRQSAQGDRQPVQEKRQNHQQNQQQPNARPTPQQGQRHANAPHDERGQQGGRDHRPRGGEDRRDNRREPQRHERRGEEARRDGNPHRQRHEERRHDHEHSRSEVPVAGPKTGKMRPGRLFGWLVSFESADGRAIELREGKFFITGSSIRGTDLVIEDPSISTPHALMSVSSDHGLLLQDLMSERGIFVRSGDRGQYKREDGAVELKHGDWVRFGDVEFLLTVVPGGSR